MNYHKEQNQDADKKTGFFWFLKNDEKKKLLESVLSWKSRKKENFRTSQPNPNKKSSQNNEELDCNMNHQPKERG